ncbi:MAG: ribonuclease R [Acidaminococcales bacterium]|jgi:ribonuclease R|nr:ribonuclease R [Acidaminococcales bacterium]
MKKNDIERKLLELMEKSAYRPMPEEEILESPEFAGADLKLFWAAVKELLDAGRIVRTRFGTYGLPEKMNLVVGSLSLNSKGFGFVLPERKEMEDIFIAPGGLSDAMNGDRVIARVSGRSHGRKPEGEIVRILKRANTTVVGNFVQRGSFAFVAPDDKKITQDVFIAKKNFGGAKDGQKVVAEFIVWPQDGKNAEGRIVEVLGDQGDKGLDVLAIIKQHGLATAFPKKVLEDADKANSAVEETEFAKRRDLCDRLIVTIDSDDAKDLDDAVRLEEIADGSWLLGVYIADVSYYVQEDSPLDKEARERATSVYLADRVLPMLPERLSNGLCSLNADEPRLAMACEMKINGQAQITDYELFPAVIKVRKRLSYSAVREALREGAPPAGMEPRLFGMLRKMDALSALLHEKRMERGAVDFDFPEQKIRLDANGRPTEVKLVKRTAAERIIEEFMLKANETVARHLFERRIPAIYRVHEQPDEEKMAALAGLLATFGLRLTRAKKVSPSDLQKILRKIAGKSEEKLIAKVMLRSLKQAEYGAENSGHFGLASKYYTHFTSPIRRYPDLVIHRLLKETLKRKLAAKRREKLEKSLPEIAVHSSRRERVAEAAERAVEDLKKAEYMREHIGEVFPGHISGVTSYGLFVELESGVEGLLHVSALTDDYYVFIDSEYRLVGEGSGKVYRLGDPISVEVLQASAAGRTVDFVLPGRKLAERDAALERLRAYKTAGKKNGGKKTKSGEKKAGAGQSGSAAASKKPAQRRQ